MAQIAVIVPDFSLKSTWIGIADPVPSYTTPSEGSASKEFSLSGIPAGATITAAVLTATLGSPYTGAAYKRVDGVSFSGSMDVLAKVQDALASGKVIFIFTFRAKGGQGSTSPAGVQHSGSLSFSNVTLTITYTPPASTGSLDKTSVDAGQNIKIKNITPGNPAYTHKVIWSMGGQNVTHGLGAGVTEDTLTVPNSWMNTIPNATSGQAQCVLETYNGTTLMGSNTYKFTVKVPSSVKPTVTITIEPVSDSTPAVPSGWGVYVKGKSKARITANAAGAYGSTITSYKFTDPDQSNPFTSGLLTAAGQITYTCEVTDSRGRKATSDPVSITVLDYTPPTITAPQILRCLADKTPSDTGTYIRVKATLGITSLGGKNSVLKRRAYYRKTGDATWLPANGVDLASMTPDMAIGGGAIDPAFTWQIKLELADSLTPADNPVVYIGYIPTESCIADLRPDRAALGRRASWTKCFALPDDWTTRYRGSLLEDQFAAKTHAHSVEDITSGTLAVARGGTGQTSLAAARNAMGLGNTTGALPVANGGTGATSKAAARTNLGFTSGTDNGSGGANGDIHFKHK